MAAIPQKRLKWVWVVIITPYYVTYIGSWMRVCKLLINTKPHQMANTLKKKEGKAKTNTISGFIPMPNLTLFINKFIEKRTNEMALNQYRLK